MTRFRLVAALAVLASASVAAAQSAPPPSSTQYASLRLGAFSPKSDDLQNASFNTGFCGEIAFGYRAFPNFAAELGVGYFRSQTDTVSFTDPTYGTLSTYLTLSVVPITATAKLILPLGQLEPYAAAGVGLYMATLKGTVSGAISGSASNSDNAFGVHFGAGLLANVSDRVALGLDVRYVIASGKFNDIGGGNVSFDGLQFGALAAYRF
jgi:opacity protein-like surface antigen